MNFHSIKEKVVLKWSQIIIIFELCNIFEKNKSLLKTTKAKQEKVNSKINPNLKKVKSEKPLPSSPVALIGKQNKRNPNYILTVFFLSLFSFFRLFNIMDAWTLLAKHTKKIAIIIIINYYYQDSHTVSAFFSYFVFLSLVETFSTTLEKYTWVSSCYITRQLCQTIKSWPHSSLVDYLAQVIHGNNYPSTFYCIFHLVWVHTYDHHAKY